MESELRLVLIVLGLIAIIALVAHGIYTIRKNKANQAEDYEPEAITEPEDGVISAAKVVSSHNASNLSATQASKQTSKQASNPAHSSASFQSKSASDFNPLKAKSVKKKQRVEPDFMGDQLQIELPETTAKMDNSELDDDAFSEDFLDQLTEREALEIGEAAAVSDTGSSVNENTTNHSAQQSASSSEPAASQPEEVLILNVIVPEGQQMSGAVLLPVLLTLGFKFGEFNIFHRHQETNGEGEVLFSLANMFNPGTFDIDNIEQFTTHGISLFLSLPAAGESQAVFNMMHNAAKKIAAEFNGQVLDGQRSVLTRQTLQHYNDRIREFERRQLLSYS